MYYSKRFLAFIIDFVILGIISSILMSVGFFNSNVETIWTGTYFSIVSLGLLGLVISVIYYGIIESTNLQASLGKKAMKLKVVDKDGKKLSFIKSLTRNINKVLSSILCFAGFILIFAKENNQALHDWFGNVFVVEEKSC